jgi:predicted nucleotidyltransferase
MHLHGDALVEPPAELVGLARRWLAPVREALGQDFVAAYLTGSVLTQGFDPKLSHVNVLVVSRSLDGPRLEAVAKSLPAQRKAPFIDPLFLSRNQIESSLDSFPIEWVEIQERHLRLEGDDVFSGLQVPRTHLRLQCEHELRGKHIQLRQNYLLHRSDGAALARMLRASASGFATLFRTLLRLRGEPLPAEPARIIQRVAELYELDAQGLLSAHLFRYSTRRYKADEVLVLYHRFLAEVGRLIGTLEEMRV